MRYCSPAGFDCQGLPPTVPALDRPLPLTRGNTASLDGVAPHLVLALNELLKLI